MLKLSQPGTAWPGIARSAPLTEGPSAERWNGSGGPQRRCKESGKNGSERSRNIPAHNGSGSFTSESHPPRSVWK